MIARAAIRAATRATANHPSRGVHVMRTLSFLLAIATFAAAGCMNRPYQGQALYALDGGAHGTGGGSVSLAAHAAASAGANASSDAPAHAGVLRLREVTIASPYATTQFVYRYADGRMRVDPYAGFIGNPESLIGRALVAKLSQEQLFDNVGGWDLSGVTAYELVVSIRTLGAIFGGAEGTSGGTAQVTGVAFVLDPTAPAPLVLATFEISASEALQGDDSSAVAAALNTALASWMNNLGAQLRSQALPAIPQGNKPDDKTPLEGPTTLPITR